MELPIRLTIFISNYVLKVFHKHNIEMFSLPTQKAAQPMLDNLQHTSRTLWLHSLPLEIASSPGSLTLLMRLHKKDYLY